MDLIITDSGQQAERAISHGLIWKIIDMHLIDMDIDMRICACCMNRIQEANCINLQVMVN